MTERLSLSLPIGPISNAVRVGGGGVVRASADISGGERSSVHTTFLLDKLGSLDIILSSLTCSLSWSLLSPNYYLLTYIFLCLTYLFPSFFFFAISLSVPLYFSSVQCSLSVMYLMRIFCTHHIAESCSFKWSESLQLLSQVLCLCWLYHRFLFVFYWTYSWILCFFFPISFWLTEYL